ncbi:cohesin domain-containing protein [Paenibacillus eucommiae]|uniref:Dockerin domain-containing protein n=1 Tax=Paenibacillus eucommiae TaxID=1355755 RepID=A0ABS4INX4_9BACL|nr:cohesin domain-containing protein [Paenibacillus eucommiae]MBP1988741.1 hypothetical protein [Paenibacillus eucommiae]
MKKKIFLTILAFSMFMNIISVVSATVPPGNNDRLQYFGYYGADGSEFGNPTDKYLHVIGDMANSNVALIHGWIYGQKLRDIIETAASKNMKVILHVYDIFFAYDAIKRGYLVGPWASNWATLKQTLSGLEDNVLGFYFDEPWLAGVKEEDFRFVTKLIGEDFPDKKVMQVSALADLDPGNTGDGMKSSYLEYVTDVGFDYYSGWEHGDYLIYHERLKALANKNQNIWLIPRAFSRNNNSDGMQEELLRHYDLALKDSRVIGILPFNFPSGGDWGKGLEYFFDETKPLYDSYLKNTHIQVGKSVIANEGTNGGTNDNLYVASFDFSSVQGDRGWYYQQGDGSSYTDLAWDTGGAAWQGTTPLVTVGSDFQYPDGEDAIRKWVAPKSGTIQISTNGNIRKSGVLGDGVRLKLLKNGTGIWPEAGEWKLLQANDTSGITMKTTTEVQAGDVLYFVVNQNASSAGDKTLWNPVIVYKTVTEASSVLTGPESVIRGDEITMQIGIKGDPLNFTSWQGVLNYDPDRLQFATKTVTLENNGGTYQALADDAYTNVRPGFQLLSSRVQAEQGKIFISMASTGNGDVVREGGNLLTLDGSVKTGAAIGTTEVSLADLKVSVEGADTEVAGTSMAIQVYAKVPVDPDELLTNPGFENGTTGWEAFYQATLTSIASPVSSGSKALRISERDSNYTGAMQDIKAILLDKGQGTYNFGGMLRTESGTQRMYVNIFVNDSEGEHYFNASFESVGSDKWVRSSGSANITWTGELKTARIYMESMTETGKGNYFVDDFSLKKKPLPVPNQSTLTASASTIPSGAEFKVNYGLSDVSKAIYAQDIKLDYDPSVMDFVSAKSLIEGVSILETIKNPAGKLRLIVASQGSGHAVTGSTQVVELTFKAKKLLQTASGDISITSAALGDDQAAESQAALSSIRVEVTAESVGGSNTDINGDGKVTIGDLSILAALYGKNSSSPDWQQVKRADVNGDGKIDILDLAAVAKKIVE